MRDLHDLEIEAEQLAAELRGARCCDALTPCNRCQRLRLNLLARRRVVEVAQPAHDAEGLVLPVVDRPAEPAAVTPRRSVGLRAC